MSELTIEQIKNNVSGQYYTSLLYKTLTPQYQRTREGWHISDFAGTCVAKTVFTKLDQDKEPISERTFNYFFDGEAIDEKVRKVFENQIPGQFDTHMEVEFRGITGRPDVYDIARKRVIELKTTDPSSEAKLPKKNNLHQLMAYMAVIDVDDGTLWYHFVTRKKQDKLWVEFEVKLNAQQRSDIRRSLGEAFDAAMNAYEKGDARLAPNVAGDPDYWWLCASYCPYVNKCPAGFKAKQMYFEQKKLTKVARLAEKYGA
jgi:hypothetical protein